MNKDEQNHQETNTSDEVGDIVTFQKGDLVFEKGQKSKDLYIIRFGKIRLLGVHDDRVVLLDTLKRKDFLGGEGLFHKKLRPFYAVAAEETQMMRISLDEIKHVLGNVPFWVDELMKTLSERLTHSYELLLDHKISGEFSDDDHMLPEEENLYTKLLVNED